MNITNFDATNIPPQQAGGKHPVGNGFPFQITNTYGKKNNDTPGGQFVVEFTSPGGMIVNRYNLWNANDKAREIAHKELSALCHAVGIFKLSFEGLGEMDYGRELRGGRGVMDVGLQDNLKPDGYVEVKKVYDSAGNEPGKSGAAAAPQPQGQGNGGWGAQTQAPAKDAPASAAATQGWQAGPANNTAPAATGGQTAAPPWARS